MPADLPVCQLPGLTPYAEGLALQEALRAQVLAGALDGAFLVLEHEPVYTRGRRTAPGELLVTHGIEVVETRRGGKATYHGPGQVVGYPIVAAPDVVAHVRALEDGIVAALRECGVTAARSRPGDGFAYTGVWVEDRKVASVGVHVSRGVATHGFAVNVDDRPLEPFGWITACGLPEVRMTSVRAEGGTDDVACLRKRVAFHVCRALGVRQRLVTRARLESSLALAPS